MWKHSRIHQRKGMPYMSPNETGSIPPITTAELNEFMVEIAADYMAMADYDPEVDIPELTSQLDPVDLEIFEASKIEYLRDVDRFKAIEECLSFREARQTPSSYCINCKYPFSFTEKRKQLYCSCCGQLLVRNI